MESIPTIFTAVVGIMGVLLGSVLTYFITIITQSKTVQAMIDKHQDECIARRDIQVIKSAIVWLVTKNGGKLSDLGLDK